MHLGAAWRCAAAAFSVTVYVKEQQAAHDAAGLQPDPPPTTCSRPHQEVISGCYGAPADVWSCGVVAFALLSGRLPFEGSSQQEVLDAIAAAPEGPPSAM
jgi:serine/threonine protein kinase